eukprot:TRINITY_DN5952_c0_g1_i1.p1 TRINITY_DN5952_c0_g1~~TRINITY_DN5952_c0_g1_i1.p1  ORF type:complete len:813 (+),score=184.92 TRINITY_DN5952_c0_g1_i1:128-2566(+)
MQRRAGDGGGAATELDRCVDVIRSSLRRMGCSGGYVKVMVHRFVSSTKMLQRFARRCIRSRLVIVGSALEKVVSEEAGMKEGQLGELWQHIPCGVPRREAKVVALNIMYTEQRQQFREEWRAWNERLKSCAEQLRFELAKEEAGSASVATAAAAAHSKYDSVGPLKAKLLKLKSRRPRFMFEVSAAGLARCYELHMKQTLVESVVETMDRLGVETDDPHIFRSLFARYHLELENDRLLRGAPPGDSCPVTSPPPAGQRGGAHRGRRSPPPPGGSGGASEGVSPMSGSGSASSVFWENESDGVSVAQSARASMSRRRSVALQDLLSRLAAQTPPPGGRHRCDPTAGAALSSDPTAGAALSSDTLAPPRAPTPDRTTPTVASFLHSPVDERGAPAASSPRTTDPYPWSTQCEGALNIFPRAAAKKPASLNRPLTTFAPPASPRLGARPPKHRHFHDRIGDSAGAWNARWRTGTPNASTTTVPTPPPSRPASARPFPTTPTPGNPPVRAIPTPTPAPPAAARARWDAKVAASPEPTGTLSQLLQGWYSKTAACGRKSPGQRVGCTEQRMFEGDAASPHRHTVVRQTAKKRVYREDDVYHTAGAFERRRRRKRLQGKHVRAAAPMSRISEAAGVDAEAVACDFSIEDVFKDVALEAQAEGRTVNEHDFWGLVDRTVQREQRRNQSLRVYLNGISGADDDPEAAARIEDEARRTRLLIARLRREEAAARPPSLSTLVHLNNTHAARHHYNATGAYSARHPPKRYGGPVPVTSLVCRGPALKTPGGTTYHYHRFWAPPQAEHHDSSDDGAARDDRWRV